MKRTITITALHEMGVDTHSVKDNSPRGFHTAYTSEINVGDEIIIDNHFTTVTAEEAQPESPEEAKMKYETTYTAPEKLKALTLDQLLTAWESTEYLHTPEISIVRGWLMDEIERRNPEGFSAWLDQDAPEDKDLRRHMEGGRTMKRYRDAAGRLTLPIDQIAAETQAEARAYYQDGQQYAHQGRVYTMRRYIDQDAHGQPVEIAQFTSADGYNLFTDPASLGTFLPGVASDGLEITRV